MFLIASQFSGSTQKVIKDRNFRNTSNQLNPCKTKVLWWPYPSKEMFVIVIRLIKRVLEKGKQKSYVDSGIDETKKEFTVL